MEYIAQTDSDSPSIRYANNDESHNIFYKNMAPIVQKKRKKNMAPKNQRLPPPKEKQKY